MSGKTSPIKNPDISFEPSRLTVRDTFAMTALGALVRKSPYIIGNADSANDQSDSEK